jgi:ATP-binding cassette subfamily B protein
MKSLFSLFPYLKKYRKKLIIGFIFVAISIVLQAIYPLVIGNAVDELSSPVHKHEIFYYSLISIVLILFGGIFLFFTRQTIIVVSREIENDLRYDFFSHLQFLSRDFYNRNTTGDIMAHATNDINNVRNFLGPGILYSVQTLLRTGLTLFILFNINPGLTAIALVPLPLISYIVYRVMKSTYSRSMKVQEAFSLMTAKAQENFSGIRVIKSYVREEFETKQFDNISQDYQKKNLSLARLQSYSFPMMFLLTGLSIIIVVYFGGLMVIKGTLTLGNVTEFIVYLGQLTWPMIAFGWIINLMQRAAPSMKRLMDINNTKPEIADDASTNKSISEKDIKGEIEFRSVSFKYPDLDNYILKDINLVIKKGESLGIIGHTGVGKSTLINLIPRVYDIVEGEIFIDGNNIKKIPLDVLRKSVGIVPQESFLFSDTIENNILYSVPNENLITKHNFKNELVKSSQIAGLYKDVQMFPDNFKTILGERGITLSGGQKQRTAIARAVFLKPKILILDDSLSAVDTSTEEEVIQGLKEVMKERTTVMISHRISTIKNCNNIIVLSDGKISEQGTHEELLKLEGEYYNIYLKQLLEEEIEKS